MTRNICLSGTTFRMAEKERIVRNLLALMSCKQNIFILFFTNNNLDITPTGLYELFVELFSINDVTPMGLLYK